LNRIMPLRVTTLTMSKRPVMIVIVHSPHVKVIYLPSFHMYCVLTRGLGADPSVSIRPG
jgi:hypothetical protein